MIDPSLAERLFGEGIVPLSERTLAYLQVLVTEFALIRQAPGCRLELDIGEALLSINSSERKRIFHEAVRASGNQHGEALKQELADFAEKPRIMAYRFACPEWPLRYANGGVLPVVQMGGRSYFVLFYREAFPAGWNIANGGSDNREELLEPGRIVLREFGEELLIVDHDKKNPMLYLFDPGEGNRPSGYQEGAVRAWTQRIPDLDTYTRGAIPLKLVDGPDSVAVKFGAREKVSTGVFLNITPDDNAIEIDQIALINLGGNACFLDGEIGPGGLYNRIVGLFDVETMKDRVDAEVLYPDRLFLNARERQPDEIGAAIAEYLTYTERCDDSRKRSVADYRSVTEPFRLCPITRVMIGRYYQWLQSSESPPAVVPPPGTGAPRPSGKSQIFISHRSSNVEYARWLFQHLRQHGYEVFFSDETLAQSGESDYAAAINRALEQTQVLVVLATSPEDLRSGWVEYEWRSFLNEVLSGRKPEGQIFTLLSGVRVAELPYALRSRQMVPLSLLSPHDAFECLRRFIDPVFARPRTH